MDTANQGAAALSSASVSFSIEDIIASFDQGFLANKDIIGTLLKYEGQAAKLAIIAKSKYGIKLFSLIFNPAKHDTQKYIHGVIDIVATELSKENEGVFGALYAQGLDFDDLKEAFEDSAPRLAKVINFLSENLCKKDSFLEKFFQNKNRAQKSATINLIFAGKQPAYWVKKINSITDAEVDAEVAKAEFEAATTSDVESDAGKKRKADDTDLEAGGAAAAAEPLTVKLIKPVVLAMLCTTLEDRQKFGEDHSELIVKMKGALGEAFGKVENFARNNNVVAPIFSGVAVGKLSKGVIAQVVRSIDVQDNRDNVFYVLQEKGCPLDVMGKMFNSKHEDFFNIAKVVKQAIEASEAKFAVEELNKFCNWNEIAGLVQGAANADDLQDKFKQRFEAITSVAIQMSDDKKRDLFANLAGVAPSAAPQGQGASSVAVRAEDLLGQLL